MSGAGSALVTTAIEEAVNIVRQLGGTKRNILDATHWPSNKPLRRQIEQLSHKAGNIRLFFARTRLRARSAKLVEEGLDVYLEYPKSEKHCTTLSKTCHED